jgi:hypothetical protein
MNTNITQWTSEQCKNFASHLKHHLVINNSSAMIQQIILQAVVTPNEVQINNFNMQSPVKQVLTPTAVKVYPDTIAPVASSCKSTTRISGNVVRSIALKSSDTMITFLLVTFAIFCC